MKDFHVRRGVQWIVMSIFLTVAGCGGDSGTNGGNSNGGNDDNGGGGDPTQVAIGDNFFSPTTTTVSPGATVRWTWSGNNSHNVTFDSNAITNSVTQTSGTFQTAMPTATESVRLPVHHPSD